jgi:hypothetical protein
VGILTRRAWSGYDAPSLRPSDFCALRKCLRSRPRLRSSDFCLRPSILVAPQELGFDGSLGSLVRLYREHPTSGYHRLKDATKGVYIAYANRWARLLAGCRIAELTGLDIMNFHALWGAPRGVYGEPHAGSLMAFKVLRVVLSFGRACGFSDCKGLLAEIMASGFRVPRE